MAAAKKTMRRTTPEGLITPETIDRAVREYDDTKTMFDSVKKRFEKMKGDLRSYVETHGYKDEKGHIWLDVDGGNVSQLKVERRVSTSTDFGKAEKWLKENDLWESCSEEIPARRVLDEDKLLALGFDGVIPKRVFDGFTVRSESFAFKTV